MAAKQFNSVAGGFLLLIVGCLPMPAWAQLNEQPELSPNGIQLGDPVVQRWQVGAVVQAPNGPVRNLLITIPIPTDWPEQTVKVLEEEISPNVGQVGYRVVADGVKQMLVRFNL